MKKYLFRFIVFTFLLLGTFQIRVTDVHAETEETEETEESKIYEGKNFELLYEETDSGISIIGYSYNRAKTITIPDEIDGLPITAIADSAFYNCSNATTIVIPQTVTYIGESAFLQCSGLTKITLPEKITSIGAKTFFGCSSLAAITIPASVTSIGESAFYDCSSLTGITIPNSVTEFGSSIFSRSGLTSIKLPESMTEIPYGMFYHCSNLKKITFSSSVVSIGEKAFSLCNELTQMTIPNSIQTIGEKAFSSCKKLNSVVIGTSVQTIADYAFYNCKALTDVVINGSGVSISSNAFQFCTGLKNVTFTSKVQSISSYAFVNCTSITNITIEDGVQSIGDHAFSNCTGLVSITLPDSVISFGADIFKGCSKLTVYSNNEREDNSFIERYAKDYDIPFGLHPRSQCVYEDLQPATFKNAGYSGDVYCKLCENYVESGSLIWPIETVKLSKAKYIFDGKVKTPSLIVKDSLGKVIDSSYYTVTRSSGRKKAGTYKYVVKFKGNYSGTKTLTFKIYSGNPYISELTTGYGKIKVTLENKKVSMKKIPCQIWYKQKGSSKWKHTTTAAGIKTIRGLKEGSYYYFKARVYRKINGKMWYGPWSKTRGISLVDEYGVYFSK